MNSQKILVVEDDPKIAQVLLDYLKVNGYQTQHFADGNLALKHVQSELPDLILLDRMLPGMDGVQLCRAVRQFSAVPIVMLTAMIDEGDRLDGFEAGADDYVCKPFSPREVMARVKAQLRRSVGNQTESTLAAPIFAVNDANMSVSIKGQALNLTTVEFRILAELIKHPSRIYSRQQLLNVASEDYRESGDRTVDSHIKNIRKKIAAISDKVDCLQSVYGAGYRFEV